MVAIWGALPSYDLAMERHRAMNSKLTPLLRFQVVDDFCYAALMASSDVDQKFLGRLARDTETTHPFLASMLFKVLGLSVLLSKKLVRARRLRRLDTTRDTKSLQLYHRIIWLSREGLVITEQYILPMADDKYPELKVLATKLRASFYHIFVLFHNQPSINQASIPSYRATRQSSLQSSPDGGPVRPNLPPGLAPISVPKPSGNFLLPAVDYIPTASLRFAEAAALAEQVLSGSHPLRASVKVEYAAYLYDCLHDGEGSRRLAKTSLNDVYIDEHGMDDDMFEETAKLVVILDKMARRGLSDQKKSSGSAGRASQNTTPSTPRAPLATGAHPSMPSPASRRSPEEKRSPGDRRTPSDKRSPEQKRSPESKRTPEKKRSPPEKRSPESKRSSGENRTPEKKRSPPDERGSASNRSPSSKRSPEQLRNSSDRRSPEQNRSAHDRHMSEPRRSSSDKRSSRDQRSPELSQNAKDKRRAQDPRTPEQSSSSSDKRTATDRRSPSDNRSSSDRRTATDRRSPSDSRSSKQHRTRR